MQLITNSNLYSRQIKIALVHMIKFLFDRQINKPKLFFVKLKWQIKNWTKCFRNVENQTEIQLVKIDSYLYWKRIEKDSCLKEWKSLIRAKIKSSSFFVWVIIWRKREKISVKTDQIIDVIGFFCLWKKNTKRRCADFDMQISKHESQTSDAIGNRKNRAF